MIRAVIFDMDGLLIDTERYLVKNWQEAARRCGYALTRAHALEIRSLAAEYARPYLQGELGADFDYDAVRALRRELMEADLARDGIALKPGARELLCFLRAKGVKTAVATATDEERARRYLESVGIADAFDHIVCAPMVAHGKPAPDIYLHACAQVGEPPRHCLALEDSPNGVCSAHGAGCRVAMIPDQSEPDAELTKILWGVSRTLADVKERIEEELHETA